MEYCNNCGKQLNEGAKFCENCGTALGQPSNQPNRKVEYEGTIHKCPNCGEILKSFEIICPTCGYELRGIKASSAVKEFAMKLEAIESTREHKKQRGIFAAAEAQQQLTRTDEQKISLIKSFIVPNSKEDMLEFMILATSNINMNSYDSTNVTVSKSDNELNTAWLSKVNQVYEKAKRVYSTDDVFVEIKALYDKCNHNISKNKKKGILKWVMMFGWLPILFAVIFLIVAICGPKDEAKEIERLNDIVVEIEEQLENGEYKYALMNADDLVYSGSINNDEQERKWEIEREYWIDKVIDTAAENGVILERPVHEEETTNQSTTENSENHNNIVEGFLEGVESGFSEAQENIDEFNQQISTEEQEDFKKISIENFTFSIPEYYKEEGSRNDRLQYYAHNDDKIVKLIIAYPEETDNEYDVSFNGLAVDNENMIDSLEMTFDDGNVYNDEVFESEKGVKGILYSFTYKQKISLFKKIDGTGHCFCFPSTKDRRWFYVIFLQTDNVVDNSYEDDYMKVLSSLKES